MQCSEVSLKACLLGATFETNNLGVNALTASVLQTLLVRDPDAKIFLLDYGKTPKTYSFEFGGRQVPIQLLNMRFSWKIFLKNNIALLLLLSLLIKAIPSEAIRKKMISHNKYLKALDDSDVIAAISGGDSFSDIYGLQRFFYVSLPQLIVLLLGRPLTLLPQTLGPFKNPLVRELARYIMRHATKIYSRDHHGIEEMISFLKLDSDHTSIQFCYDVGFILEPIKPNDFDQTEDLGLHTNKNVCSVGLNISGLLSMGGYSRANMFGLRIDYLDLMRAVIERFLEEHQVYLILVPHVYGEGQNSESDALACEKLFAEFQPKYPRRITRVVGKYNQNQIKYIIGMCDFFIGARMHACIAALSQYIPAVGIAYSRKFIGVFETIGIQSLVADPRILDYDQLMAVIFEAFEDRGKYTQQLEAVMPEVRDKILTMSKFL